MTAQITAFGGWVPDRVVGNVEIAAWTNRTPEWIEARTGILERRYADEFTPTSGIAVCAVDAMVRRFPVALDGVSRIVLATSTPDRPQPPSAALLQDRLGLSGIPACDINSVCAGFLFALDYAAAKVAQRGEKVLVVGADKYSGIMDRNDPTTVSLFGDGAGAIVVEPGTVPGAGLRSLQLSTHGEYSHYVTVPAGGSETPHSNDPRDFKFQMAGRKVKEYVLETLPQLLDSACYEAGIKRHEIGAFICHQANVRLLTVLADALGVDPGLVPMTAPRHGNTGAASLPLTLAAADRDGLLVPGRPVALLAVGGGMSAGAAIYIP